MEINSLIRQVMEGAKPSELEGILYFQDQIVEIAKLVAAKYETALVDYINHVGYCEGTDFISDIDWVENKTSVEIIKTAAIQARTKWKE
jgi:hypothetical protein